MVGPEIAHAAVELGAARPTASRARTEDTAVDTASGAALAILAVEGWETEGGAIARHRGRVREQHEPLDRAGRSRPAVRPVIR